MKGIVLSALALGVSLSFAASYQNQNIGQRTVKMYVPDGLEENRPLLISCHGMDQDPEYQQQQTRWEQVADTARFLVVYPRGGTGFSTWDIGGDQDTKFILDIINEMHSKYKIDLKRVYLSGFSMGGMFSYHAMGKIADKIAAFAPTSGYLMGGPGKAMRPVPIFHTHGTGDGVVGYDGLANNLGSYRQQFNCPNQAVEERLSGFSWPATLYTWGPCDDGIYVKHLKFEGRDHHPSPSESPLIWNFIKDYSLDGVAEPIIVPTARDSIFNSEFNDSLKLAGWSINVWDGAASLKHDNGAALIDITTASTTEGYNIQMLQNGIKLSAGTSYKITFDAWADNDREIEVNVEMNDDPWDSYLPSTKTIALTKEKQTFEVAFTMNANDENARVVFNAGLNTANVHLDNITLKKIDASEVPDDTIDAITPKIQISNIKSDFKIYNTKGECLGILKNISHKEIQKAVKNTSLKQGIYFVKNKNFNQMIQIK